MFVCMRVYVRTHARTRTRTHAFSATNYARVRQMMCRKNIYALLHL
jgi:hypothetical protein